MSRFAAWFSVALFAAVAFLLTPVVAFAQDEIPVNENPVPQTSSSILDGFLAMSNTTLYLVLVGITLSAAYAFIYKQHASDDLKALVFALVCVVAGAVYAYVDQDSWQTNDWIRRSLVIWGAGTAFYLGMKSPLRKLSERGDALLGRTN